MPAAQRLREGAGVEKSQGVLFVKRAKCDNTLTWHRISPRCRRHRRSVIRIRADSDPGIF